MKQPSKIITPPYLKPGDKIGIVCTARKTTEKELEFAVRKLKSWGLQPVTGSSIGKELHQFAGDDFTRARDLQQMLDDDSIRGILCARGGYGTVRIVDKLDFSRFRKNPKWIIGYSDVTVFHSHLHALHNVETLHASMPVNFRTNTPAALSTLRDALFGRKIKYQGKSHKLDVAGQATGQLVGGNLSILYSISGSRSETDTRGKILFLEDLDEYLYHIDRMMVQLKRAGKLRSLKGLVIGGFTQMRDNEIPFGKTALEIVQEHVRDYHFPVAFGFPAGHVKDNRALIMGRKVHLRVNSKGYILNFL